MSLVPAAVADVSVTPADSHLQYHFIQLKTSKVIKMNNEQDWGCRPKHSIMWWGCDICRFASSRWWWYTLTDNYKFLHSSLRNIHPLLQLPASCLCSGVSEEKQKYSNKKLTPHLLFFLPSRSGDWELLSWLGQKLFSATTIHPPWATLEYKRNTLWQTAI